jgi:hypothetical protein
MERRLKVLEDYRASEEQPDPFTEADKRALDGYNLALSCIAPLLADDEDLRRARMVLQRVFDCRSDNRANSTVPDEGTLFPWAMLALLLNTPPDQRSAAVGDMYAFTDAVWPEDGKGPSVGKWPEGYVYWLVHSMALLLCRIPPDIDAEAVRGVVDVCLREKELDKTTVCTACGMYWAAGYCYLRPRPEFFAACPHCGGTDRVDGFKWWELPYPWQKQAADELLELRAQAEKLDAEQAKEAT